MRFKNEWRSRDGKIRLIHGDALRILSALEPGFDAVVTDPPYSSGGMFRGDRMASTRTKYVETGAQHTLPDFSGDNKDQRSYLRWSTLWLQACRELVAPGGLCCVFTDWRQLPTTTDAIQCAGWIWRGIAVWMKTNSRPVLGRYNNQCEYVVWGTFGPRVCKGPTSAGGIVEASPRVRQHITQKPERVMHWLLEPLPGGRVLDPFAGSGTTLVACMQRGQSAVGIEQDRVIFDQAVERLAAAEASAPPTSIAS